MQILQNNNKPQHTCGASTTLKSFWQVSFMERVAQRGGPFTETVACRAEWLWESKKCWTFWRFLFVWFLEILSGDPYIGFTYSLSYEALNYTSAWAANTFSTDNKGSFLIRMVHLLKKPLAILFIILLRVKWKDWVHLALGKWNCSQQLSLGITE